MRTDFAALYLDAAAAGFEFGAGGVFCGFGDFDFIDDGAGAGGFGHSGGRTLVLNDVRLSFDSGDAVGGGELETIFTDF